MIIFKNRVLIIKAGGKLHRDTMQIALTSAIRSFDFPTDIMISKSAISTYWN